MAKELPEVGQMTSNRLAKAAAITDELVQYAVEIHEARFSGTKNPAILPAIIQALATNYSALLASVKK